MTAIAPPDQGKTGVSDYVNVQIGLSSSKTAALLMSGKIVWQEPQKPKTEWLSDFYQPYLIQGRAI